MESDSSSGLRAAPSLPTNSHIQMTAVTPYPSEPNPIPCPLNSGYMDSPDSSVV